MVYGGEKIHLTIHIFEFVKLNQKLITDTMGRHHLKESFKLLGGVGVLCLKTKEYLEKRQYWTEKQKMILDQEKT